MSEVDTSAPESREAKIAAALAKHGETAAFCWDVFGLDEKQRRKPIVARVHGLDFDEYEFGKKYGPGEYQRALKIDGNGRVPQILAEAFTVDARINVPERSAATAAASRQDEPPSWAKAMMERIDRIERPTTPPPTPSPAADAVGVKDLIELFKPMIAGATTPRDSGLTLKDVLPLLMQRTPAADLAEMMDVAGKYANKGGGGDDGLGAIAGAFATAFADARSQRQAVPQQVANHVPARQALLPGGGATPPVATAAPTSPEPNRRQPFPGAARVAAGLRPHVAMFSTPAILAENVPRMVTALEEEIVNAGGLPEDVAQRYADAEAFTTAFIEYAPDYEPHRAVVLAVATAFLSEYEDDTSEAPNVKGS